MGGLRVLITFFFFSDEAVNIGLFSVGSCICTQRIWRVVPQFMTSLLSMGPFEFIEVSAAQRTCFSFCMTIVAIEEDYVECKVDHDNFHT